MEEFAEYVNETSILALLIAGVTIYKSVEFWRLTNGNKIAWYFVFAVLGMMIRRISLLFSSDGIADLTVLTWERILNPVITQLFLLIFIYSLVKIYRENLETLVKQVAVVESAVLAFVQVDNVGIITSVNQAFEHLTGFSRDKVVGQPLINLLPERYRQKHLDAFNHYIQTGEPTISWSNIQGHILTSWGTEMPVKIALADYSVGETKGFVGILQRR